MISAKVGHAQVHHGVRVGVREATLVLLVLRKELVGASSGCCRFSASRQPARRRPEHESRDSRHHQVDAY